MKWNEINGAFYLCYTEDEIKTDDESAIADNAGESSIMPDEPKVNDESIMEFIEK